MRPGIFAKTFARPSPEGVFDAFARHDLSETQFNMSVAGLPPEPVRPERRDADAHLRARLEDEGRHAADAQTAIAEFLGRVFPSAAQEEATRNEAA